MSKQVAKHDPSVSLYLRAFIELKPDARAVVEALWLWEWAEGFAEGLGIPDLALIAGISERQVKRMVKELKEKKDIVGKAEPWIISKRPFGRETQYKLAIPIMTWPEAKQILAERLGAPNWATLAQLRHSQSGQPGPSNGPHRPDNGATQAPANIKISSSSNHPETHPSDDTLLGWQARTIFKNLWEQYHPGETYIVTGKDKGAVKSLLENKIAPDFFKTKVLGYLSNKDPFIIGQKHSLSMCCSQFNKWAILEEKDMKPHNQMEGLA